MSVERVWEYYCNTAEISGFGIQNNFKGRAADQNRLVRAFLGDEQAKEEAEAYLQNGQLSPEDKERMEGLFRAWEEDSRSNIACPNDSQKNAIRNALNYPISLVQGPPGTGKTEMILNLLSMINELYPQRTVAVVSSNNEALKNIYEQIENYRAKEPDHHISRLYDKYSVLGSQNNRRAWRKELTDRGNEREADFIDRENSYKILPDYLRERPLFSSTVHSLCNNFKEKYENGNAFDGQFDYVIMDESSQAKVTLGLAAMVSAKNTVFVGDDNQLAPIIEDEIVELNKNGWTDPDNENAIPDEYVETEGRSILSAVPVIFPDVKSKLLNEHYRCHSSIITFCNEYVYDNKLDLKKEDDPDSFRMRAVWYEGDYCEKSYSEQQLEDGRCITVSHIRNQKQIEILLSDLRYRLSKGDTRDKSILVLSPFKAEITELKKRLDEEGIGEVAVNDDEEGDLEYKKLIELTIHKSQGKGQDIVYFLTTADYYSSTLSEWFQQMRMINVAVSRAKEEFCIVTSSRWLPDTVQKKLTGYVLNRGPHAQADYGDNGEDRNKGRMFCCKLLEYICNEENRKKWRRDPYFGLHKYETLSVFDKIPLLREKRRSGAWTAGDHESAAEQCVYEMLTELADELNCEYDILEHVPLRYLKRRGVDLRKCGDSELREFVMRDWTTLDFVICQGKSVKLIIEVDGSYHRDAHRDGEQREKAKENDSNKDKWVCDSDKLDGGKIFIRMPTDGTFIQTYRDGTFRTAKRSEAVRDEKDFIRRLLSQKTASPIYISERNKIKCGNAVIYEELKKDVLEKLNGVIEESYDKFREFADPGDISTDALSVLAGLNFENAEEVEYEGGQHGYNYDQQHNYYIYRYAPAYAFDYSLMYDVVMRSMKRSGITDMDVTSFGCGTMIDALAMVYAKAALAAHDPAYGDIKMTYTGIDAANWGKFFVPPKKGEFYICGSKDKNVKSPELSALDRRIRSSFDNIRLHKLNIVDEFDEIKENPKDYLGNVIIFPRILNELHTKTGRNYREDLNDAEQPINRFMDRFAELAFDKTGYDEYYICVSHSRSDRFLCMDEIDKLVDRLTEKNKFKDVKFKAESDIYVMMGMKDTEGKVTDKKAMDSFMDTWTGGGIDELTDTDSLLLDASRTKLYDYSAGCYAFKSMADEIDSEDRESSARHIRELNGDFECAVDLNGYMKELEEAAIEEADSSPEKIREMAAIMRKTPDEVKSRLKGVRTAQISTARYTFFQIIRLKKEKKAAAIAADIM